MLAAARELSWFAIRQPTIIHFLERRLWSPDGDAFAVALDAACRLHDTPPSSRAWSRCG